MTAELLQVIKKCYRSIAAGLFIYVFVYYRVKRVYTFFSSFISGMRFMSKVRPGSLTCRALGRQICLIGLVKQRNAEFTSSQGRRKYTSLPACVKKKPNKNKTHTHIGGIWLGRQVERSCRARMCAEIWTSLVHVWMWAPLPLGSVLFTRLVINKTLLQRLVLLHMCSLEEHKWRQ